MIETTIAVPEDMKALIDARISDGAFADIGDYIRDLIRQDLAGGDDWELTNGIATALDHGEASGVSERTPDEVIAEARARYLAR